MEEIIRFTVPGQPVGWQRAGRNGIRSFTKKETLIYETKIRNAYLEAAQGHPIINEPIAIDILAYYAIPSSWSRKRKRMAISGDILPTVKPDADNVLKCIDGLNCSKQHPIAAWADDKQVVDARIRKYYSDNPRTEITITILK